MRISRVLKIFLICIVLFLFEHSLCIAQTDSIDSHQFLSICKIIKNTYEYKTSFGETTKYISGKQVTNIDKNNLATLDTIYFSDGSIKSTIYYKYNIYNKIIEKRIENYQGYENSKTEYVYDDKNNLSEENIYYKNDNDDLQYKYIYNNDDIKEIDLFTADGTLRKKDVYLYNNGQTQIDSENRIELIDYVNNIVHKKTLTNYGSNNSTESFEISIYNSAGFIIENDFTNISGYSNNRKTLYIYDEHNNLINIKIYELDKRFDAIKEVLVSEDEIEYQYY